MCPMTRFDTVWHGHMFWKKLSVRNYQTCQSFSTSVRDKKPPVLGRVKPCQTVSNSLKTGVSSRTCILLWIQVLKRRWILPKRRREDMDPPELPSEDSSRLSKDRSCLPRLAGRSSTSSNSDDDMTPGAGNQLMAWKQNVRWKGGLKGWF